MKSKTIWGLGAALVLSISSTALAQSTGASPADPQNERNQRMAPSNTQPSDPAADMNPEARVPTSPTSPVDRGLAEHEEGGATGTSTGESGSAYDDAPDASPDLPPPAPPAP